MSIPYSLDDLSRSFSKEFQQLESLILEKNKILNLTRIVSHREFLIKHIEDSLKPLFFSEYFGFPFFEKERLLLDLGTGGGFPLLPLAVMMSGQTASSRSFFSERGVSVVGAAAEAAGSRFCGLDSVKKKTDAVNDVAASMGLSNVRVYAGRAEEFGRLPAHREKYDALTCRAVAEIPVLLEYASPLLRVGGLLCLYKSGNCEAELEASARACKLLNMSLAESFSYELSESCGGRTFLVFRKLAPTSSDFPRKVGIPKKNPLI